MILVGAMLPGLMRVGCYLLFVAVVAVVKPTWVPALPEEARTYREDGGSSGRKSLLVLFISCGVAGYVWSRFHSQIITSLIGRVTPAPGDETFIMSLTVASFLALGLAMVNRAAKLPTFVMFILGCFIDFFEIAFIVVTMLIPVALWQQQTARLAS